MMNNPIEKADIKSWTPRYRPSPKDDGQGGYTSEFYEEHTFVKVFSYVGGKHGNPFTVLEAYYHNQLHQVRLPQWYHPRWHGRLAHYFDWRIAQVK